MNGIWLLILLGRWSMVTGWIELFTRRPIQGKREFVSVDALGGAYDLKINDPRSYEMLGRDKDGMVTPDTVREGPVYPPLRTYLASANSPMATPSPGQHGADINNMSYNNSPDTRSQLGGGAGSGTASGRHTPDYFGQTARYNPPQRSFSSPRPPTRDGQAASMASWGDASAASGHPTPNPAQTHSTPARPYSPPTTHYYNQSNQGQHNNMDSMNPLQMNRI